MSQCFSLSLKFNLQSNKKTVLNWQMLHNERTVYINYAILFLIFLITIGNTNQYIYNCIYDQF